MVRVVKAFATQGHWLALVFSDGTEGEADLSAFVATFEPFRVLEDVAAFRDVLVVDGAVTWPRHDLNLATERLYAMVHGLTPPASYEDAKANEATVATRQVHRGGRNVVE